MKRTFTRALIAPACMIGVSLAASHAFADTETLTFDSERNAASILNYYNGGMDSLPQDGVGPSDGVVFAANANALKNAAASGTGKFENNPSGNGVLYFAFSSTPSQANYIDVAGGFNALSFSYSLQSNSPSFDSTVNLYSGLNGTGTLLDSISLSANPNATACTNTRADSFCTWSLASTAGQNFGTAESITFGSAAANTEFDSMTISAVPLPGGLLLLASGLAGLGGLRRRQQAQGATEA